MTTLHARYIQIKKMGRVASAPYNVLYVALMEMAMLKPLRSIQNKMTAVTAPAKAFFYADFFYWEQEHKPA